MIVFEVTCKPHVSGCDEEKTWAEEFRRKYECPKCGRLAPEWRERPLDVRVARRPGATVLNYTSLCGIGIIRLDFLALFEEEFRHQFTVGRVLDREGQEIAGFATFVPRKPLIIRSNDPWGYRVCEGCGRFVYTHWGSREDFVEYITRDSIGSERLYGLGGSRLIMTAELRERIVVGDWTNLFIRELPVLDQPLDGIDPFPENYY